MMKKNKKEYLFLKIFVLISIIAIVMLLISTFVFPILKLESSTFGDIATVLSIFLAVVSIFYTYVSGEKTSKNLDEIKKQSESLVNQIIHERSKDNYDSENVANILDRDID